MIAHKWHLNEVPAGTRIVVDDIPCGWLMKGLGDTWVIQIYGMKIYADSQPDIGQCSQCQVGVHHCVDFHAVFLRFTFMRAIGLLYHICAPF